MSLKNWVQQHQVLVAGSLIGAACAGAVFSHRKTLGKLAHSWRLLRSVSATNKRIITVTSPKDWKKVEPLLLSEASCEGAVGFDCEWAQSEGRRRPVALLQVATCSGLCILVRLCNMKSDIPDSLKAFLENGDILKVGVGCIEDSDYLTADYNIMVRGCVDLRHLEVMCQQLNRADSDESCVKSAKGMGLNALTEKYLGHTLDKNWRVVQSNWEAETLTKRQMNYAAEDALVGIHILMRMVEKLWVPTSPVVSFLPKTLWNRRLSEQIAQMIGHYCDFRFSSKKDQDSGLTPKIKQNGTVKQKSYSRAYSIRKEPLYHHCQLWAPDDMPLCMIDPKKARWYVKKGLGTVINENPLIVQLKFEPAGRPLMETQEGKFRLQERENICVVCGKDDSYIRKNIVPHEYRKFFPAILKSHENHDIVLLCVECHQRSNVLDNALRTKLAEECNAPIGSENGVKATIDKSRKRVKHAACALIQCRHEIPETRINELEYIIKEFFNVKVLDIEHIEVASRLEVKIWNKDYQAHSEVVFEAYKKIGLVRLEQRWREHFLDSMKPVYMPDYWSTTHNAIKVRHKMSSLPLDHPERDLYKMVLVGTDGYIDVPYDPTCWRGSSPDNETN